jgi:hypothetical protein
MNNPSSLGFDIMATVLRFLSYRVVIYSNDHRPSHVHVMNTTHEAIFVLGCPSGPPALMENYGFRKAHLALIASHLQDNLARLCTQWSTLHGSN